MSDPVYPDAKSGRSFQVGMEFQDFVCSELAKQSIILQNLQSQKWQFEVGENLQGFEIKFDGRCSGTGRLSIEVAEKTRADETLRWTDSGINRNDNSWLYIQGNYDILFIFAKKFLLNYLDKKKPPLTEKMGTVRTFYISNNMAKRHAAKVLVFHEDSIVWTPEDRVISEPEPIVVPKVAYPEFGQFRKPTLELFPDAEITKDDIQW